MRFNWGTGIALVYGLFAACTTTFVVFAMRHPVQLVSEDYYARSLQHDDRRTAVENADALALDVARATAGGGELTIELPPIQARDARGAVRLYRPSDSAADRCVPLAVDAAGRQHVSLDGLVAGRWVVQIDWTSGGRSFYREVTVMVR
ncbi:MAG: FixH family protein [Vicinamibacteria bacterium]|nr:FixH family protein [Vicinamibacteria bacterium]